MISCFDFPITPNTSQIPVHSLLAREGWDVIVDGLASESSLNCRRNVLPAALELESSISAQKPPVSLSLVDLPLRDGIYRDDSTSQPFMSSDLHVGISSVFPT